MNICIVSTGYPPEDGGGIGTYTYNLARGLKALGHSVFVFTRTYGEDKNENIDGVEIFRFKSRYLPKLESFFPHWTWSKFIAKKIKKLDAEVGLDCIEFPNWEGVGYSYLKMRHRRPVNTRVHTPYFETLEIDRAGQSIHFGDKFTCWLEKRACQKSDSLISSTKGHRQKISGSYHISQKDIDIVPLGIKVYPFKKKKKTGTRKKVLYVSRLEHRKGALDLLNTIPKVLEQFQDVDFVFIGKDRPHTPEAQTHKKYFQERFPQCSEHVDFLGFVDDDLLAEHYQACDVFVVPSIYESFGLIYIEAMMYGKPVIGCAVGGVPEVISDGETGFLIQPNNRKALADQILALLTDDSLREQMGKNARKLCEEKFTSAIMAENTSRHYQKIIENYG